MSPNTKPWSRRQYFQDSALTHHKSHRLSYEDCFAEAQKYENLRQFRKHSWEAYSTALFYGGWLDKIKRRVFSKGKSAVDKESSPEESKTSRAVFPQPSSRKKRSRDDVTLEWCLEVAKHYKNYESFRKNRVALFELCEEKGWTNELQMVFPSQPPADAWNSKEACHQEALKYSQRKEFRLNSPLAYTAAVCHRWLDEVCSHMESSDYRKYDSFEKCQQEALCYSRRIDFIRNSKFASLTALKYGWMDEICEHMQRTKRDFDFWEDKENCRAEALKYSNREEFLSKHRTAYLTSTRYGWLDEICEHMTA